MMKLLLSILLTLATLADFSAGAIEANLSDATECMSSIFSDCENSDFHNSEDDHGHQDHGKHSHGCHAGHIHLAILKQKESVTVSPLSIQKEYFPAFLIGKAARYQQSIIRPPIS